MKKLTIGDLKKFIEEHHLPDDMMVFVPGSYGEGMVVASSDIEICENIVNPYELDYNKYKKENTLEIFEFMGGYNDSSLDL